MTITRPYTTAEVAALFLMRRGVTFNSAYYNNVIKRLERKTTHPLARAKLARGMWDRTMIDNYLATKGK